MRAHKKASQLISDRHIKPQQHSKQTTTTTMYDYSDLFGLTSTDLLGYSHPPDSSPPIYTPPLTVPNCDLDSAAFVGLKSEVGYSSSSSYGSPSYCYSRRPNLVQRSLSSHSLHNKDSFYHPIFSSLDESPPPPPPPPHILDFDTGPMRKVHSTGDLEGNNTVRKSGQSEGPGNCTMEVINKAIRYTAEERKERIERYRSKRNQRNFNKKIKYACRKTLADSRPRIRGRFARNDEMGENSSQYQYQYQYNQLGIGIEENTETDDIAWQHLYEAFSIMPH